MSSAANIDDFVKGRMPGQEAADFQQSAQNDSALRDAVNNQQMVVDLFQQMNNESLAAEIQEARHSFENEQKVVPDEIENRSNNQTPETSTNNIGGLSSSIIKILFNCDDELLEVIELNYSFKQDVDDIGQPSGKVTGGLIEIKLPFTRNEKWYAWMIDSTMKKDGVLIFMDANGQSKKRLIFKDAYCLAYKANFEAYSNEQIKENATEVLTIIARTISIGGESFEI